MSKWNTTDSQPKPQAKVELLSDKDERRERLAEWTKDIAATLLAAGKITPSAVTLTAWNLALEVERRVYSSPLPVLAEPPKESE